jgi:hypothetical protein
VARIRSVKPGLRTSRTVASWPVDVRYFFVLLWGYLDDKGRGLDIPKAIAGDCFPLDDRIMPATVDRWLSLMAKTKVDPDRDAPICRYEVTGRRYVHCVYWGEHQKPNRPSPSMHPPCPVHEGLTESVSERALSPQVLELGYLTEGEVDRGSLRAAAEPVTEPPPPPSAEEPPPRCPKHLDDDDPPPCHACGDARRSLDAWRADQAAAQARATALARQRAAHDRAEANRLAIAACRLCDDRGYLGGQPCPHDPDAPARTRRGAAAVRAALTTGGDP